MYLKALRKETEKFHYVIIIINGLTVPTFSFPPRNVFCMDRHVSVTHLDIMSSHMGIHLVAGAERKHDTQMSISHTDRLCVCVTLLQPLLYMKGNMKPIHVRRTVSNIRPLWNCRENKTSHCQHLLWTAIIIRSSLQSFLPETRLSVHKQLFQASQV